MIFRCLVCATHWIAHDSSASVTDSLCDKHRRQAAERRRLPVHVEPVKSFYDLDETVEFRDVDKPSIQLLVMKNTAAALAD